VKPGDPCGACGCERRHHNPPAMYTPMKETRKMGEAKMIPVLGPTCCCCPFCLCFCPEFKEPFRGQKYSKCLYDRRNECGTVGTKVPLTPGKT
jgi:hypothetical protein